ncbi:DUF4920 domain-containing protein [Taibaiella sp. KBW10]|uniref:DUF4920 domain-containing protein n=1 Tax=Taibaiella sp. KBW10 TaxID=2153357 RepID=UPI000F5ADB4A|nr:DUF4920 domain-containing protein [Taibaiella sp. KBW10]RQO30309.1 DUF4920 domain-containing protein [Taibaiella sp. KBW10]
MKQLFGLLLLSALSFTTVTAQTAIAPAAKGVVYGTKIAEKKVVNTTDFDGKLKGETPVKMQLKGTVTSVCEKRGCWANVDLGNGKTVFVKMKDYAFFLPMDIKGKQVLLSGEAYEETTSVDELRHYAEDAKKSKEEIEAIKEPVKKNRFTAAGITVLD